MSTDYYHLFVKRTTVTHWDRAFHTPQKIVAHLTF
jgi:hypothetical protein